MLFRNTLRQIKRSLGRFLAIFAIVALGVGFFVGLRVSKDAMVETGDKYFEELNLFDFRLVSTLGLTDEDVDAIADLDITKSVRGSVSADMIYVREDGSNGVLHMHTILEDINNTELKAGRLPESPDECLIDSKYYSSGILDSYIELSKDNPENTFDTFSFDRYKVVGVVDSPYYINFERGSSSLGGVSGFAYIPAEGFDTEYYTEIFVTLDKTDIDDYDAYETECESTLDKALTERGKIRYNKIRGDALEEINDAEEKYADGIAEFEKAKQEVYDELASAEETIATGKETLSDVEIQLADAKEQIEDARLKLEDGFKQLDDAKKQYETNKVFLTQSLAAQMEAEIAENEIYLNSQKSLFEEKEAEYNSARLEYETKLAELESGEKELADKRKEAEEEFAKTEDELKNAREEIDEAKEKLDEVKEPATFVLGRSTNIGYSSLNNDTEIVAGVSKVFPLFFFIVASLVCVTTMTRMVDDQRVQNGTLKALGYGNGIIAFQYLFYAGSASLAGCIVGFLAGSKLMPMVLWKVYHIMYTIDRPIVYILDWELFAFCIVLYFVATLGTTMFALAGDLKEPAAELIRPKAPTAGKRILLERIGFIWNRIKFLHKVSIRNILRYKKRMFMMIVGVGGCTALLLTGFGIRDSIQPILDYQFHEIHSYDLAVSFLDPLTQDGQKTFTDDYKESIAKSAFVHMEGLDLTTNGSADSATLVVADSIDTDIVNLHNGSTVYSWPEKDEVIINYRLARDNDIHIGDVIEFRDNDYNILSCKVTGIFDNYLRDYAYISTETYEAQFGKKADINSAYLKVAEDVKHKDLASDILGNDNVSSVNITESQIELVGNMLSSLDYIVLIVLVCAGALAFIVIYNLTNISITERIREIATIKVLGFYEREAAGYVFRENLVLSFISSLVGIPLGIALHRYVMAQIKIKSMYFGHRILGMSFVWSIIITFIFAVIVDIFMYFKLKEINMAESLKAVD